MSRVTRRLEDEVEALRNERLAEPITYLFLDATFIDARWARSVENVSALVAYGFGPDGQAPAAHRGEFCAPPSHRSPMSEQPGVTIS